MPNPATGCVSLLATVVLTACVVVASAQDQPTQPRPQQTRADRLAVELAKTRRELRAAERRVRILERVARHDPSVQEALTIASIVYRIPRRHLATVAWCESGHRPLATNGQYRGIFQWGPSWGTTSYRGLSPFSPYAAALAAAERARIHGWGWWTCKPRGAR